MNFRASLAHLDPRSVRHMLIGVAVLAFAGIAALLLGGDSPNWSGALAMGFVIVTLALTWLLVERNEELRDNALHMHAMRRQQTQHEAAEKMASLGLWMLDLRNSTLRWSNGAFRVYDCDREIGEPSLESFVEAIHPDDRRRWSDSHRRALRKQGEIRVEYRYLLPDKSERWLRSVAQVVRSPSGTAIRLEGTVQDISGMRAMQRQLASSEAKFRDLTNLSSDWIWETDPQHRISFLSDSTDAVLGQWAKKLIGKRRWENDHADPIPNNWDSLRESLAARKAFEDFECSRMDEEGNIFHLALSGRPVFDEKNQFAGYRGTGHNITREKQQRLLLEIDGDISAIMREQSDPNKVITAIIITVCGKLAWLGGLRLERQQDRCVVRERWGYPKFTRMASELPRTMATDDKSVEARVWQNGKAIWLNQAELESAFAKRYDLKGVGAKAAFVAPVVDAQGKVLSALLFLAPVGYKGDEFLGQVAAMLSRTLSLYLERTSAERKLLHASQHDALTGLPNRAFIARNLESLLTQKQSLALLYIDLDRYKIINDTLGHSAGDKALIEVANRLAASIPDADIAGRMGGDEFIIILKDPGSRENVELAARKVLKAIEQPLVLTDRAYFLSASIGVAMAPDDSSDASLLIKAADGAMYQVKSEGRNDVRFFAGDVQTTEQSEQLQLAAELPMAMQRGEVDLFYQPVLDVRTRKVLCIEGLIRWRHPKLGLLLPDRFLPIAEQSNLIREIGFWAIRHAIDDRLDMGLDKYDDMAVSVNISVRQLAEEGFLEHLYGLMQERNFPPHLLRLELTESSFIENPERTVALISELRRLGVKVIIDNFGTGYASLSYIKNLPVDGLKIDRAFVQDLPEDRGNAAIVQAVTTLAAKLGMQAMAEGVETANELRGLRELQCDVMQGSLISEPIAFSAIKDFLDALPGLRRMHLVGGETPN